MVVLTPAEELGLSGLHLDSRVRKAFYAMSSETILDLSRRMNEEAGKRHLLYLREGEAEVIHIMLRPIGVMPDQLAYLNFVSLTILNALKRLPDLYLQDFAVRQDRAACRRPRKNGCGTVGARAIARHNPVLGRLDAVVEFTSPMWKDSLRFMEPNLCGVGGLHMGPTCEQLLADIVLPAIHQSDPELQMEVGQDLARDLHSRSFRSPAGHRPHGAERLLRRAQVRRPGARRAGSAGPVLSRSPRAEDHARRSARAVDRTTAKCGTRTRVVDIAYRDYEVRDLIHLERDEGVDVEPIRAAVSRKPHDLVDGRRVRSQELLGDC